MSRINAAKRTDVGLVKYDITPNNTPIRNEMFGDVCIVCSFADLKLSALSPKHTNKMNPIISLESKPVA